MRLTLIEESNLEDVVFGGPVPLPDEVPARIDHWLAAVPSEGPRGVVHDGAVVVRRALGIEFPRGSLQEVVLSILKYIGEVDGDVLVPAGGTRRKCVMLLHILQSYRTDGRIDRRPAKQESRQTRNHYSFFSVETVVNVPWGTSHETTYRDMCEQYVEVRVQ